MLTPSRCIPEDIGLREVRGIQLQPSAVIHVINADGKTNHGNTAALKGAKSVRSRSPHNTHTRLLKYGNTYAGFKTKEYKK